MEKFQMHAGNLTEWMLRFVGKLNFQQKVGILIEIRVL